MIYSDKWTLNNTAVHGTQVASKRAMHVIQYMAERGMLRSGGAILKQPLNRAGLVARQSGSRWTETPRRRVDGRSYIGEQSVARPTNCGSTI